MELIDTLIEARWIIPIVPKGVILENSALAVNAGRIVDILPFETAEKTYQAQKVFRFPTSALLPGFVNLHSHAAMNLVRGLGADLPLMDWLTKEIWPAEGKLMSPEFVAASRQRPTITSSRNPLPWGSFVPVCAARFPASLSVSLQRGRKTTLNTCRFPKH